jgi:hypothetical protein
MSTENPAMIAYTPNEVFGKEDRQLTMRPGKYLTKFFPNLSQIEMETAIAAWKGASQAVLQFAYDPEEIAWVYENGPRSCMAADGAFDQLPEHPAYVYGAGELAVAYFKNHKNSRREQKVAARVLTWPEKQIFSSSQYGDYQTLRYLLTQEGFIQSSTGFTGAKLLRIPTTHKNGFVMPYMDICCVVTEYKTHFMTGDFGELGHKTYDAGSTAGYVYAWGVCDSCGRETSPDDMCAQGDNDYCTRCWEDLYSYCSHCGYYINTDDVAYRPHLAMFLCTTCEENYYYVCSVCNALSLTRNLRNETCGTCRRTCNEQTEQEGVNSSV